MPKSHLVTLIVRLAIGVIILGVLAFLIFARLRKRPTPGVTPTPIAITTESPITIVTPTPAPSESHLPEVPSADGSNGQTGSTGETKGGIALSHDSEGRMIEETRTITTITRTTEAMSDATSGNGFSQSTATAGNAHASASAGPGFAHSSASAN